METLYTVNEVAKTLKISASFLYKLSEKSEIGSVKIGAALRFSDENIKDYIKKFKREQKPI